MTYMPMDVAPGEVLKNDCVLCTTPNCVQGSFCCLGTTSTWTMQVPTAKQLSLQILYYSVKRSRLPFYRFIQRWQLQKQINNAVFTARCYGYFKIGKIK